jgi:hypothetical protein
MFWTICPHIFVLKPLQGTFRLFVSHCYPINDRTTKKGLADKLLGSVEI